jgi:internalin A
MLTAELSRLDKWRSSSALRYGVWLLAVISIFLLGRGAGCAVTRVREAQSQQALVAELEPLGAHIYYDFQFVDEGDVERLADDDGRDARPHWLAGLLGRDLVHRVFYVSLAQFRAAPRDGVTADSREEIDDRVVTGLCRLRGLRWVALNGTQVSDAGVARLTELPHLERLWLSQTRLSDKGMASLSQAEGLTHLAIEGTLVTDAGLEPLAHLPNLRTLSLGNPQLTDAGVSRLRKLTNLRALYLDRTPVGDAAADALAELTGLEKLSLRGTRIGNEGLRKLSTLTRIETLHLDDTPVADEGLAVCSAMPKLQQLSLTRTRMTDRGLGELAGCRELQTLNLEGTACSLSGVRHLFVEMQRRSLTEALEAVATVRRDSVGRIIALDLQGIAVHGNDLEHLAEFGDLQWLALRGAALTDADLPLLLRLDTLTLLNLNHTHITDAGLMQLLALPRLSDLHVAGSDVTDEGIAEAQRQAGDRLRIYALEYDRGSSPPDPLGG